MRGSRTNAAHQSRHEPDERKGTVTPATGGFPCIDSLPDPLRAASPWKRRAKPNNKARKPREAKTTIGRTAQPTTPQLVEATTPNRSPPLVVTNKHQKGWHDRLQSAMRVGGNTQDLSWINGQPPGTLSPEVPLAPRTVLSMRCTEKGVWRGTVWRPSPGQEVSHPARHK